MSLSRSTRRYSLLALPILICLTACGQGRISATLPSSGGSTTASAVPSSPASSSGSSSIPAPVATKTGANGVWSVDPVGNPNQQLTPPGTKLKFGEPAYVSVQKWKKGEKYWSNSIQKVTVTSIKKGDLADFAGVPEKQRPTDGIPWYVTSRSEIVFWEGNVMLPPHATVDGASSRLTEPRAGNREIFLPKILTEGFTKCKYVMFERVAPGIAQESCRVFVAKEESGVQGVFVGNYQEESPYLKNGIIWTP